MKETSLEILCCPLCQSNLALLGQPENGTLNQGGLRCSVCERHFPIEHGIVHFIDRRDLEGPNRRFARFYDWFSPLYTLFSKTVMLPFGGDRKARKVILDRLEMRGGRILEVSIGTGVNLPYLYESQDAGEVYGLDISSGQLSRCRQFINRKGWPVDLFHATAEALPFKAESFDSILHIGGINFFSDKKRAIEEMIRVARPGTRIVIADETQRLAKLIDRTSVNSTSVQIDRASLSSPIHLLPDTMEDVRVDGIWKMHGQYHGYCLEFRKPS